MIAKKRLSLQPINYHTLKEELCFFIGQGVVNRFPEDAENLKEELLNLDCLTVCRHVVRGNDSDYYMMMTKSFLFYAERSINNNFGINNIKSGREFKARKNTFYQHGVFLITVGGGVGVVINHQKITSSQTPNTNWGMPYDIMEDLCEKIDQYFFDDVKDRENSKGYKVDLRFEKQILTPLINYTHYEDLAEQIGAYGNNYLPYDERSAGRGKAKKKKYTFVSKDSEIPEEGFQSGDNVAVETTENINDELKRKINGVITSRKDSGDGGINVEIEFVEQFDESILPLSDGKIFQRVNEAQKRVRETVIKKINNGTVDSKYMYHLFSNFSTEGYAPQPGWKEFETQLMQQKYPPTKSQLEAIKKGIETKDIQLVLGPPGTGKTTVIVSWVKYFIGQGKRVLVSSQNNSAVDNVLERIGDEKNAHVIRVGNIDKIQENCKKYAPEAQIDSTAELYINRLGKSKEIINSNLDILSSVGHTVRKAITSYEEKQILEGTAQVYKTKFRERIKELINSKSSYDYIKVKYDNLMNDYLRKSIAIRSNNSRGKLWHFINRRRINLILELKEKLRGQLDTVTNELIEKTNVYNTLVHKFVVECIYDPEYKSFKERMNSCRKECEDYSFELILNKPFDSPVLSKYFVNANTSGRISLLKEFLGRIESACEKERYVLKTIIDWETAVNAKRNEIITKLLIENSNVVGATCIGINTRALFRNLDFDVSIIDESGQIQIHNAIVPMSRAPKTLMLGDHLQIPPMADEAVMKLCRDDGVKTDLLEMSFFEYLFTRLRKVNPENPNLTMLDEQFRMPGVISDVISEWFYEGRYKANYDMSKWNPIISGTQTPLILISTSQEKNRYETGQRESKDNTPGYCNVLEADAVARIVKKVLSESSEINNEKIGIISAYGKQVRCIRKRIKDYKMGLSQEQIFSMVASLDSFQGQERPLIIYSSTRSTYNKRPDQARVGFMKELRRLNVAFTRCQKQLVIIGDFDYLTSCRYEKKDEDTGEPVPNQSEKKYAEFIQKMVDQAKCGKGEYYLLSEFYEAIGVANAG